jgi:hypothetical protein
LIVAKPSLSFFRSTSKTYKPDMLPVRMPISAAGQRVHHAPIAAASVVANFRPPSPWGGSGHPMAAATSILANGRLVAGLRGKTWMPSHASHRA